MNTMKYVIRIMNTMKYVIRIMDLVNIFQLT